MSDQSFETIFNERYKVMLAVKKFEPSDEKKKAFPVTNEDSGTTGIRADWKFDLVSGGYKISLDHPAGEPEFRLALDIESVADLKNGTQLRVIKSDQQVCEGSDLWALVGSYGDYYLISLVKNAGTVYALDSGAKLHQRTHVWLCVADPSNPDSKNQKWETNPIPVSNAKK